MSIRLAPLFLLPLACLPAVPTRAADAPPAIPYARVHAVFAKHCLACHDAKEAEGEFVMESFDALMKGGDKGPAVVPGKADESLLVQLIERRKKPFMPPPKKADKIPDADVALIRAWIDGGAPGPKPGEVLPALPVPPRIEPKVPPRRPINALAYSPAAKVLAVT